MKKHPFVSVNVDKSTQIILTPCPGTKEVDLSTSIAQLKQAGTTLLITLMFDQEIEKNNIQSISHICSKQNITWLQLPIVDDEAPAQAFEQSWLQYKTLILHTLSNKGSIAIHCKGGTGRTGLVAALILQSYGWPIEKIISSIQAVRPKALKIEKQLNYLRAFVQNN